MKKIYICAPVRGDSNDPNLLKENIARAAVYSHHVYSLGNFPLCSQIYLEAATGLQESKDINDRPKLLELGLEMLLMSDELWVFGRREGEESSGMKGEIEKARELGLPIHYSPAYLQNIIKPKSL